MEYPYFDWRDGVFLMAQFSLLLHIDQAVGLGGIERLYHSIRFISFGILASSFFISFVLPAFQYQSVRSL